MQHTIQQQPVVQPCTTRSNHSVDPANHWEHVSLGGSLPVPNVMPRQAKRPRPFSYNTVVGIDVDAAFNEVDADLRASFAFVESP